MAARRNVSVCLTLGRLTLGRAVDRTPITSSLEAGRIRDATRFGRPPDYIVRTS